MTYFTYKRVVTRKVNHFSCFISFSCEVNTLLVFNLFCVSDRSKKELETKAESRDIAWGKCQISLALELFIFSQHFHLFLAFSIFLKNCCMAVKLSTQKRHSKDESKRRSASKNININYTGSVKKSFKCSSPPLATTKPSYFPTPQIRKEKKKKKKKKGEILFNKGDSQASSAR